MFKVLNEQRPTTYSISFGAELYKKGQSKLKMTVAEVQLPIARERFKTYNDELS